MQHDVFALTHLQYTVQALQHAIDEGLFLLAQLGPGLNDNGFAFEQNIDFDEAIGGQSGARGYQVTNKVGPAELWRYFDSS